MHKPCFFNQKITEHYITIDVALRLKKQKTKRKCDKCDNRAGQKMTIGIADCKYLLSLLYFDADTMRNCKVL